MLRNQSQCLKKNYDEATRRAVSLLKQSYPHLVGIMVQGSLARRELGPFSDIDIIGVTGKRKPSQFSYFDGQIYVTVGFQSLAEMEKEFKDAKQFFWARGSAITSTRILYDPRRVLRRIMLRWKKTKASRQILENALWEEYHHIIEYSGKLRNGWLRRDEYLTRYAARVIAQHVEYAVAALNDLSFISENYVLHQVLDAKKKPRHLRMDYPLALGIKGTRDTGEVYRSALRLCREILDMLREESAKLAKNTRFRTLLAEPLDHHGL